jgi:hypothetical protein
MADTNSLGEIISKETADQDFGMATFSLLISSDLLQSLADRTPNLLMFNIIDDRLVVLGDDRKPLYPDGYVPPSDIIFKVYSKDKVLELIESGGETDNSIEYRGEIITITNGDYTLEYGALCPPWCSGTQ